MRVILLSLLLLPVAAIAAEPEKDAAAEKARLARLRAALVKTKDMQIRAARQARNGALVRELQRKPPQVPDFHPAMFSDNLAGTVGILKGDWEVIEIDGDAALIRKPAPAPEEPRQRRPAGLRATESRFLTSGSGSGGGMRGRAYPYFWVKGLDTKNMKLHSARRIELPVVLGKRGRGQIGDVSFEGYQAEAFAAGEVEP